MVVGLVIVTLTGSSSAVKCVPFGDVMSPLAPQSLQIKDDTDGLCLRSGFDPLASPLNFLHTTTIAHPTNLFREGSQINFVLCVQWGMTSLAMSWQLDLCAFP